MVHRDRVTLVAGPVLRWTRAALLAAVCTSTGSFAHHLADGLMPGPTAIFALFCVCAIAAGSMLGRPASALRITVLLMGGQTFIHGALTAMSGHRGHPQMTVRAPAPMPVQAPRSPQGRRVGSYYDVAYGNQGPRAARTELTIPAPIQHILADLTGPHAAMAIAHLAAAAIVGLWLARGEAALWTVLLLTAGSTRDLVRRVLGAHGASLAHLSGVATYKSGVVEALRWSSWSPPRSLMLARRVSRRGPPAELRH